MNEHFSIGETAKLNNISIQTLRYYDKLGIFKPEYTDPNNGYRYYHISQFFYLDIIKYLKGIQTPLEEIRQIILTTPQEMQRFLEDQENTIENEFKKLENAKCLLEKKKRQLKEQLEICEKERGEVYFRSIKEDRILKMATQSLNPFKGRSGLYVRKLANVLEEKGCIIENQYGYIYSLKPYDDSNMNYEYIYTSVSEESLNIEEPMTIDAIASGDYVCIAFDWSENNKDYYHYYQKLYNYITSNHIQTDGKVYEVSLPTNYSSLKKETFLTELRAKKIEQ
ncbi:MerR family transcriptional regulator [Paenibacillus polymyxa]|uniref:MerR family transcriptional regulator n=1 Tax=Paenibacillus polymyxa TaxID=1406 RepID=UPI0025B68A6B|nr:MerR family DNA-binding transcriptional regulator [Paenibacillus polymyxa]MDN4084528.1 MerR family DNA-binding transcriptional regulator [Paenibacillus polymyxa]MDN4110838.1 MerR family DNA-binding transcriptional regulator [Paenibacillus polymyxa]